MDIIIKNITILTCSKYNKISRLKLVINPLEQKNNACANYEFNTFFFMSKQIPNLPRGCIHASWGQGRAVAEEFRRDWFHT